MDLPPLKSQLDFKTIWKVRSRRRSTGSGRGVGMVTAETHAALAAISAGRVEALEPREEPPARETPGLDARASSLVRIATLIALDAPPAAYAWQVANAVEVGVSGEEMLGVLRAVAPQVGRPKAIAAAPEIMLALGLSLPEAGG